MAVNPPPTILILIPVFNDWGALTLHLKHIDVVARGLDIRPEIVLVDDGSTEPMCQELEQLRLANIASIELVSLRRNLGHQRALAVGLCYIEAHRPCRAVLVMDGDGEDAPTDVPKLLKAFDENDDQYIIFAERIKRSESWFFRGCYFSYRVLHLLLTGIAVRVGNFSVVPFSQLSRLVVASELWNHFAASVFKLRLPYKTVPTVRAPRLAGQPKMNFVALVTHGLGAISVFGDRVGVRLLIATSLLMILALAGMTAVILIRLLTTLAIPGWATMATGTLLMILAQLVMLLLVFVLVVLGSRGSSGFLPLRDHAYFISGTRKLYSEHE